MTEGIKFGLYLPNFGALGDARVLADLAQEAESVGWDGFFLWDHIAWWDEDSKRTEDVVDPWIALTAIAMNTQTIRIGTTVTPLPRRRPWKLARETVSLDRLSNGRLILGVGIGLGEVEWDNLGEETDSLVRGKMLDEALEVLDGLWSGEPFDYDGQYYQLKQAHFLPTPVQKPRIPIWVGGFYPNKAPMRRMAGHDGMFPIIPSEGAERLEQFEDAVNFVQEERQKNNLNGSFDIVCMGITPGDDKTEASTRVKAFAEQGATWWLEIIMPEILGFDTRDNGALEAIRQRIMQGPPK